MYLCRHRRCRRAKTVTFCNISVIIEDIYSKLGICVHHPKRNRAIKVDNSKCIFNPLPDNKILDKSKLKQSADDNFKFHEDSRKFSKRVENAVGKGEIAR